VKSIWKRGWIPCRRTTDIHAPRLRLIFPLTEAGTPDDPSPSPGLLAVFDEPWHESGGLAERLEAQVALTADPDQDVSNPKKYFFELGPDPIVGHTILSALTTSSDMSTPPGRSTVTFPAVPGIIGPVGHYFDPTNQAALFNATSFIIPPSHVANDGGSDRRWYFAKLQFRRTLVTKARELQAPAEGNAGQYEILESVSGNRAAHLHYGRERARNHQRGYRFVAGIRCARPVAHRLVADHRGGRKWKPRWLGCGNRPHRRLGHGPPDRRRTGERRIHVVKSFLILASRFVSGLAQPPDYAA
jgi:hypothetical protein